MVSNKEIGENNQNIQKMATLLRDGNTLLNDSCPKCNSPLFKLKSGDIYCAACDRKVIIVKDEEDIDNLLQNQILDETIKVINMKIKNLNQNLDLEKDLDELHRKTRLLINYLECLEKLKVLKRFRD